MWKEICLGMADDMRRLAACVEISNRPQHHASGSDNRLIGWTQKLLRAVYNRTAALNDRGILNVEDSSHPGKALGKLHDFKLDLARRAVIIVPIRSHCISFVLMNFRQRGT